MINSALKDVFGGLLILTSIFDGWKYVWNAKSIIKIGTARGHSRKFINAAILNDIIKLCYGIIIADIFIVGSSIFALGTMSFLFYTIYKYYPYRMRGCSNFKKPNIILYLINSITPNKIRKRL
jgi:hypothetical protein